MQQVCQNLKIHVFQAEFDLFELNALNEKNYVFLIKARVKCPCLVTSMSYVKPKAPNDN